MNNQVCLCFKKIFLIHFIVLVYENNPQRYAEMIQDKLLDLLEQAFPNTMSVNDLAK